MPARRLEALLVEEAKAEARIADYLDCEPAASHELQWLIRRAFSRSVWEPVCDERFAPQALVIEDGDQLVYRPLERDLLRLFDCPIELRGRSLAIESERGASHQALLCLGALPEEVPFPSRQAELMFAPLEALDFPVDACLHARHVPNRDAVRLVRRRIVDADNIYAEESQGDHGPSANSAYRPQAARELEEYLTSGERPPLLRAQLSLCVSAPSEEELEERVERLRHEYAPIELHRPLGDQLALFCSHLPGQAAGVPDYDDYLTVEQFGAMVPVATHAVGSEAGPYIGYTLSGSRQPVLFDPTEASRTSRAPATLLAGTLGSGKTLCMELVAYQAFLAGLDGLRHRPQGRPPPRRAARGGGAAGGDRALGRGALPRHARPAADRAGGHARGPGGQLPALGPARAGPAGVADRDPARGAERQRAAAAELQRGDRRAGAGRGGGTLGGACAWRCTRARGSPGSASRRPTGSRRRRVRRR